MNPQEKRRKRKEKRSRSQVKSEEQTPTVLQHTRSTCAAGSTKQARGNGGCARQQVLHSAAKVTVEEKKDRNNLFFFFPGDPPHRVDSHSFASLVAAGYCSVNMQWNASWGCLRVLSTALSTVQVWCELDLHPITNACIYCAVRYRHRYGE